MPIATTTSLATTTAVSFQQHQVVIEPSAIEQLTQQLLTPLAKILPTLEVSQLLVDQQIHQLQPIFQQLQNLIKVKWIHPELNQHAWQQIQRLNQQSSDDTLIFVILSSTTAHKTMVRSAIYCGKIQLIHC